MLPMNARSEKLLRLALCPAASQHESDAAALAFIRAARDGAETFESLFFQTKKRKVLFPFGKYEGQPLEMVDDCYLEWAFLNMTKLTPFIKKAIKEELVSRGII